MERCRQIYTKGCRLIYMNTSQGPKSRKPRVHKCRECNISYRPGSGHCDCGASHFPALPLELQR